MTEPQNRYRPPSAPVADVPEPARPPRPRAVTIAVWLMVSSIVLEVVSKAIEWRNQPQVEIVIFSTIVLAVMLGILGFLVFMLGRGRNWARLVYAIVFAIGLSSYVANITMTLQRSSLDLAIIGIQGLMQLVAVVLTYFPASNAWYRAGRENRI